MADGQPHGFDTMESKMHSGTTHVEQMVPVLVTVGHCASGACIGPGVMAGGLSTAGAAAAGLGEGVSIVLCWDGDMRGGKSVVHVQGQCCQEGGELRQKHGERLELAGLGWSRCPWWPGLIDPQHLDI